MSRRELAIHRNLLIGGCDGSRQHFIEKMIRIQDSGAYEIRVQKSTEREALAAVFSDKVDEKTEANGELGFEIDGEPMKSTFGEI